MQPKKSNRLFHINKCEATVHHLDPTAQMRLCTTAEFSEFYLLCPFPQIYSVRNITLWEFQPQENNRNI